MKLKTHILAALLIPAAVCAAEYMVPKDYDNVYLSNQSESYGVIRQSTGDLSGNNYTIGGSAVRYRCIKTPKIKCAAAVPEVIAAVSETSLRHPAANGIVDVFSVDIRIEEDATDFYVCGAAYGGVKYDKSEMSSHQDASGNTVIDYTYDPISQSEQFWYFTNQANASNTSYMTVAYRQICR